MLQVRFRNATHEVEVVLSSDTAVVESGGGRFLRLLDGPAGAVVARMELSTLEWELSGSHPACDGLASGPWSEIEVGDQ